VWPHPSTPIFTYKAALGLTAVYPAVKLLRSSALYNIVKKIHFISLLKGKRFEKSMFPKNKTLIAKFYICS
jgi:hypothetical protein